LERIIYGGSLEMIDFSSLGCILEVYALELEYIGISDCFDFYLRSPHYLLTQQLLQVVSSLWVQNPNSNGLATWEHTVPLLQAKEAGAMIFTLTFYIIKININI
jgi:hypothetical protein